MSQAASKCLFLVLGLALAGCSDSTRDTVSTPPHSRVIYGEDTRVSVTQNELSQMGAQTAVFISDQKLKGSRSTLGESMLLCSDEPFLDQVRIGFCSGVLIAPNLVLTAGHCFREVRDCQNSSIAFGFTHDTDIDATPLYRCKNILRTEVTNRADYAIVELDRAVTHITPAALATKDELESAQEAISYSYPMGLPLKRDEGLITENNPLLGFFRAEVDTFKGSSGSPLFLPNGKVAGVLSRGFDDYLEDDEMAIRMGQAKCFNLHRCDDGRAPCFGQSYYKTYKLLETL